MYSKFNADVKAMVNVESVNEKLNQYKLAGVDYVEGLIDLIETPVTDSNKDKLKDAKDALKALKAKFDDVVISNISKLEEAESSQSGEQVETEEAIRWSCDGKYTATEVTTSGNQDKKKTLEVDGVTYTSSLKMESKTGVITITITSDKTLTVYQTGGTSLKVDGNKVAVGDLVNYELKAGTHTIAKGDGSAYVFLIVLE